LLGRRSADLLGEHRGADAAPPCGIQAVLHGDVVVDHHGLDLDVLAAGEVGGHLEVHHVARVVLDDVEHSGAAVHGLRRIEHLVGRRRREHLARTGGVEHPEPDEAPMHRLVAWASARDEPDLALHRGIGANDHVRIELDAHEVGVGRCEALQCLGDDVVWFVDQLLHVSSAPVESLLHRYGKSSTASPLTSMSGDGGSPRAISPWWMKKSYTSAPMTAPTIGATIGNHQYQLTLP